MHRSIPARLLAIYATAALAACDLDGNGLEIVPEFDDVYSFESGMEEWSSRGIDLGNPPITWEIARTTERADTGTYSVRMQLNNVGEGKIWIERRYEVPPDQEYEVTLTYALASADHGSVTPWRVLAGATQNQPAVAADLVGSKDTGNGSATDVGYRWNDQTVVVRTKSDEQAEIFVYVGIWGTSQALRSYAVDHVRVTFLRKGLSAPTGPT